ncbi:MAG: hypothetical protein H8D92_02520 [Pelagibacteraceae bacterium]|nr:hypothetical protein [Pelagibacteraceae bacterium]
MRQEISNLNLILYEYLFGISHAFKFVEDSPFKIVPIWKTYKDIYLYLTGKTGDYLTSTSKMSNGSFGYSASNCKAGGYLQKIKNSICSLCYGMVGCYAFKNYITKSKRTVESVSKEFWKEGMVFLINKKQYKEFRWFDNGDLLSDKMLRDVFYIAEHTPDVKHWLPTKEYRMIRRVIESGLHKPDNLDIRLSAFKINGKPPMKLARRLGVNCSVSLTPKEFKKRINSLGGFKCHTAYSIKGKYKETNPELYERLSSCSGCTACYNNKVDVIYYEVH